MRNEINFISTDRLNAAQNLEVYNKMKSVTTEW